MSETKFKNNAEAGIGEKTIIVKKDKSEEKHEKAFNLGSKLFLVFNILTIFYTVLFAAGCLYKYCFFLIKLPKQFKALFKLILVKNNESKLAVILSEQASLNTKVAFLNENLSYYRWQIVPYFVKTYVFGALKSLLANLNPKFLLTLLVKNIVYHLPKEILKNLFFKINNFYYLALTFHVLAIGSLLHFETFKQKTLRVVSEMSNYDAMSVNYVQFLLLAVIGLLSTPAFLKLAPFMAISLGSILKNEQQQKVIAVIPWTFLVSVVPYILRTVVLNNGEGFFCLLYVTVIVVKLKFNKFGNLILLKIIALLDNKISKKYKKSDKSATEDPKYKQWKSIKRAIVAETVMM